VVIRSTSGVLLLTKGWGGIGSLDYRPFLGGEFRTLLMCFKYARLDRSACCAVRSRPVLV
jgi:hypothetical protein